MKQANQNLSIGKIWLTGWLSQTLLYVFLTIFNKLYSMLDRQWNWLRPAHIRESCLSTKFAQSKDKKKQENALVNNYQELIHLCH
jgi:hypothetical protein